MAERGKELRSDRAVKFVPQPCPARPALPSSWTIRTGLTPGLTPDDPGAPRTPPPRPIGAQRIGLPKNFLVLWYSFRHCYDYRGLSFLLAWLLSLLWRGKSLTACGGV